KLEEDRALTPDDAQAARPTALPERRPARTTSKPPPPPPGVLAGGKATPARPTLLGVGAAMAAAAAPSSAPLEAAPAGGAGPDAAEWDDEDLATEIYDRSHVSPVPAAPAGAGRAGSPAGVKRTPPPAPRSSLARSTPLPGVDRGAGSWP